MKNRFFLAISAIMMTGALLISATAQNNTVLGTPKYRVGATVYLKCDYSVGIDMFSLSAINNTNKTIPAGTRIYWQLNSTTKGSMTLSAPLSAGKSVQVAQGDAPTTSATPKAWFLN